jgi:chorismate mutase / prephenate dehydratase
MTSESVQLQNAPPLSDIRRGIDAVDDAMLRLVEERFHLVEQVKAAKGGEPSPWPSPLRPAREMQILKRLLAQKSAHVSADLLVRLWRGIVTEASMVQSPVTIHISKKLASAMGHRLRIRDYFGRFAVEDYRDEAQAMVQINANPSDIAIVEPDSPWADAYIEGQAGKAQVIGLLPALRHADVPQLLILGVAPVEATGDDETLLLSKGNLPRDFSVQPVWQAKSGSYRLTALAGFYSEHEAPLVGLMRSNPGLGLKVVGRYPTPIEV